MVTPRGLILLATAALTLWPQVRRQNHPPMDAEEYAHVLDNPARDAWQKPHEVIQSLNLRADEVVADIGAGTGYFARRLARRAGKVYAVDIDQDLLDIAAKDAPPNLTAVLAAPDDPGLPEGEVDTVFICNVLHHVDGRPAYYEKLAQALKPGGRIVIIDFHKRPLPVGPPAGMKLSREAMIEELSRAGFQLAREFDFLPHQYFLIFEEKK